MRGPGRSAARDGLATTGARPTDLTSAGMHGEQASPARSVGQEGCKPGPPNGMATSRRALVTSRRVPATSRGVSGISRGSGTATLGHPATVTPGRSATAADSGASARLGTAAPLDATAFFGATVSTGDNSRPAILGQSAAPARVGPTTPALPFPSAPSPVLAPQPAPAPPPASTPPPRFRALASPVLLTVPSSPRPDEQATESAP